MRDKPAKNNFFLRNFNENSLKTINNKIKQRQSQEEQKLKLQQMYDVTITVKK